MQASPTPETGSDLYMGQQGNRLYCGSQEISFILVPNARADGMIIKDHVQVAGPDIK